MQLIIFQKLENRSKNSTYVNIMLSEVCLIQKYIMLYTAKSKDSL